MDILHPWTLDPATGKELVPFTTFSIAMIQRQSRGALPLFVEGLERYKGLKVGAGRLIHWAGRLHAWLRLGDCRCCCRRRLSVPPALALPPPLRRRRATVC